MNFFSKQNLPRVLFLSLCLFFVATSMVMAADVNEDAGLPNETLFSLMKKGGLVMIPLGIASIIALALATERIISLRKEKVLPDGFLDGLGQAWRSDPTGGLAVQYCDQSGGAVGHVFKAGIEWRHHGYEAVSRAIEDAGSREADRMKRSVRGLSVIAGVCPLLGLMGTVFGLINAFQKTASSGGAAKPSDLAIGIYEALVTTATGLVIAVPVMLVYQYLSSRVDGLIDHIDEAGTEFIVKHARWDGVQEAGESYQVDPGAEPAPA
jgi:biopolymer transport protein ExbB